MPKDIVITPGTGLVEFRDDTNVLDAQISLDNSGNLSITNTGGTLTVGNTGANVYIGDGVNNVNMIFERSGSIIPGANQTLTLGNSTSNISIGTALRLKPVGIEGGEILFDNAAGSTKYYLDVAGGDVFRFGNGDSTGYWIWTTNNTERARITPGGYFKATSDGTYVNSAGTYHELLQTANAEGFVTRAKGGSYSNTVYVCLADVAASSSYRFFTALSNWAASPDIEFNLRGDGNAFADGSWSGGGADYAEYFEWADGNPDEEDRRGISVVLDGDKIRPALTGEDPIGAISGNPSVVGDSAWNKWSGKYLRDDYGTYILEDYEVEDEEGNTVIQQRRKLNPAYDPDVEYTSREERPEWDCVGLMGKLRIRKDQPTGPRWVKMRDISATVEEWLVR
jgi:hypothetical protein